MSEPDLQTTSLGETAYGRLRDDIVACRLVPGQLLTERGLAAETGLGTSPIRDALTRLDHDGLVQTLPRKGYRVKPLTIKAVTDLFDFWELLGPELARRGIEDADAHHLAELREVFDEHHDSIEEGQPAPEIALRTVEMSSRTFEILAEVSHNDYLVSSLQQLTNELARVATLIYQSDRFVPDEVITLENWHEVLAQRDGALAADAVRRFILQSRETVLRTLARWPSVITSDLLTVHDSVLD